MSDTTALIAQGLRELAARIDSHKRLELLLFGPDGVQLTAPLQIDPPAAMRPDAILEAGLEAMIATGENGAEAALVCEAAWAFALRDHLNPLGGTAGGIFRRHRQDAWNRVLAPAFGEPIWNRDQAAPGGPSDATPTPPDGPWYAPPPDDDDDDAGDLFPVDFGTPAGEA